MVTFKKQILIASLVLNVIFCSLGGYFVFKKGGFQYITTKIVVASSDSKRSAWLNNPYYLQRIQLFESLPITKDSIVFLGDSLTDGCEWNELLSINVAENRGISGDKTYGVLSRLDNIIASNPQKIFIMIGINDIAEGRSTESIVSDYDNIITIIKNRLPNTEIFIQSVLPVNYEQYRYSYNENVFLQDSNKIPYLNNEIKAMATKHSANFIDLYKVMVTKENSIKKEVTNDGIHLNGEGYKTWRETIKEYI